MAELEDVTLDGKPLHSLRVADLKAALEQRGLPKSGQKNALIKRLKGALMLENLQKTSSPHIGLQPNSQIGVEMSQNSFIKQYLAKQQELLRQRLEREAREAAEADTDSPAGPEEEDHTGANDGTSYLQDKHHLMPSHPQAEMGRGDHGGGMSEEQGLPGPRGLDLGPGASDGPPGRIWRPSFFSSHEESATPSPPRAVASLSVRVVGQPDRQGLPINIPRPQEREGTAPVEPGTAHSVLQLSQSAKAAGRAQEESEDDDDDDGDSDEDDEWGPSSHGRKSGHILPMQHQPVPAAAPARERSRRKLQPPQHIPPQPAVHQPAVQLRQPTPPPSPPPELSFPLPDTPKQSPPDLEAGGAAAAAAAVGGGDDAERPAETSSPPSLQRQDSSSSSRSSSPDPPGPRRPGPLSLLARKMESEGAFAVERSGEPEEQRASGAKGGSAMGGAGQGVLMFSAGMKTQPGPVQQPAMFGPRVFVSSTQEPSSTGGVAAAVKKLEPEKGGTSQPHQAQENEGTEKRREKREKEWEPENMLLWRGGREVTSPPTPVMSGKGESILGQNPTPFHLTSTTTSPPAVTKRPRMFSEVPPPSSLLCPPKSEQRSDSLLQLPVRAGVLVSGPQEAEAEVPMVAASETPKPAREDKGNKVQADPEKRALPQAAKGAEEAQKPLSLLPPSPPPEDLAKAKEQARTREKERERRSSPSSGSSSSDSDSESSSSSGSSPAHSKSLPASKKKGEEEKRRKVDGKGEERGQPSRDVKQAALPESAGSAAMEMEERPESECALTHPAPQGAPDITDSPPNESSTPKAFAARKISLTTSKTEGPSSEVESGGGANRKRRWGSSTAVTAKKPSISITTESLKSLIPDIKSMPPLDAVVELHPEEGHLSGDEDSAEPEEPELEQGLKIRRTVTQVVPADGQENGQKEQEGEEGEVEEQRDEEKDEAHPKERRSDPSEDAMETQSSSRNADAKKVTPSDTLVRRSISQQKSGVSVTVDDPVRTGKPISPPRNKVSNIIHICNLVRPFTLGQLKELLNRTGTLVEEGFWIDKIKSHCYVTYSNVEEAEATRAALHGVKWPSSNPKVLSVEFCQQEELDFHKGLLTGERAEEPREQRASGPPARPGALPPLMPDPRERGTGAVGGTGGVHDQWAEREREMARRERTRSEREWDRDKVRDLDRDGTSRRSRSRERRRRERGKSKERKTERKDKPTEEPPAKLLDDLFRKTKAAPCIYWLPLTEEQVVQRNLQRAERMKERERKRKELQEEEDKKREEERKERAKGREKEGGNAGPGGAGAVKTTEGERDRERDRERDKERERERDRVREREGDKRRDSYRGRGGDPKAAGGGRRSRSRSNPPRDRRR